jgi:hypothetical protein
MLFITHPFLIIAHLLLVIAHLLLTIAPIAHTPLKVPGEVHAEGCGYIYPTLPITVLLIIAPSLR